MKRKQVLLFVGLMFIAVSLFAASESNAASAPNQMQYIVREDLKSAIDSKNGDYILLDVRKAVDYETAHIAGAYLADVDSAVKEGKDDVGTENLKAAVLKATGKEFGGENNKYVLICYSGKAYAQKATDLLIQLGFAAERIYTLEGGNNGWSEAGDDYKKLME